MRSEKPTRRFFVLGFWILQVALRNLGVHSGKSMKGNHPPLTSPVCRKALDRSMFFQFGDRSRSSIHGDQVLIARLQGTLGRPGLPATPVAWPLGNSRGTETESPRKW